MNIQETAAAAKAKGMSYGEYVNETEGQKVTVHVPPDLPTVQTRPPAGDELPEPEPQTEPPREPELPEPSRDYIEARTCPQCGKVFVVDSPVSRKKYCSIECQRDFNNTKKKLEYQRRSLKKSAEEAPQPAPVRETILAKAEEIYQGNRAGQYGRRERNFASIAALWTAYTGFELSPADVAAMMALLKIARMGSGHYKEDNVVDAVNYLLFAAELGEA